MLGSQATRVVMNTLLCGPRLPLLDALEAPRALVVCDVCQAVRKVPEVFSVPEDEHELGFRALFVNRFVQGQHVAVHVNADQRAVDVTAHFIPADHVLVPELVISRFMLLLTHYSPPLQTICPIVNSTSAPS